MSSIFLAIRAVVAHYSVLFNGKRFSSTFFLNARQVTRCLAFVCVLASHFSTTFVLCQSKILLPPEAVLMLERVTDDLRSFSLIWRSTYSSDLSLESLFEKDHTVPIYGFEEPKNGVYMWQDRCFYYSMSHKELIGSQYAEKEGFIMKPWEIETNVQFYERVSQVSFDGEKIYRGYKNFVPVDHESVSVDLPDKLDAYPVMVDEYVNFIGYKFPNKPKECTDLPESFVLFLIKHGELLDVSSNDLGEHDALHVTIRTNYLLFPWQSADRVFRFWLLPNKNYATKQCEILHGNGKLAYRIINDYFEKLSGTSIFVPRKTIVEHFAREDSSAKVSSSPLFCEVFELFEVSTKKINNDQFNLRNSYTTPGTHVADRVQIEGEIGLQYEMPANPADLDRVIEAALTGKDFVPTPLPSKTAFIVRWGLMIVGLAMIFYALFRMLTRST